MSRKKIIVLYNLKKQPPRNVRIAVLKNFRKFPRLLFYFLLLKALRHARFPGNSLEFFRTAVLRNTSGRLLLILSGETVVTVFCSTGAVARKYQNSCPEKIRANSQEKICGGVLFLILTTKTLYDGYFPGNFLKYFRKATSRNSFGRLLLEGFLFHGSNHRKVLEKLLSKI